MNAVTQQAFLEELDALGVFKVAESKPSAEEAEASLKRLKKLRANAPIAGELGRGALVGSVVGPAASLAARAIAGPKGWAGTGKFWPGGRPLLANAGHGAVVGGAIPALRHRLERSVEEEKLKEFIGEKKPGTLRSKLKRTTGI